jgi:NAD(P)-dependent dehydrogenase (short-subunit alcohol dehydrogenase family)
VSTRHWGRATRNFTTMPTVLITGAGRGIGRATALRLAESGWDVIAGVRNDRDAEALVDASPDGLRPVRLDITSAADLAALPDVLPPALDAVVNNAGVVLGGPVEALRLDDLRHQFEVNLVGQVAVTQAVLPRLRAAHGRIVFVSSVSGRVSTPMTGAYNSSKFAIEGLADALRMELRPWRVAVSLVEPAQTDTDMWRDAEIVLEDTIASLGPEHRALYAKHIKGMRRMIKLSQRIATPPSGAAATIERALTARRPRARYVVGAAPRVQVVLTGLTPTPVLDAALRRVTGIPRRL